MGFTSVVSLPVRHKQQAFFSHSTVIFASDARTRLTSLSFRQGVMQSLSRFSSVEGLC